MSSQVVAFLTKATDPNTMLGKISIGFDSVGVTLSLLFYGFGLSEFVSQIFPPIILVLTVISLLINIVSKLASWFKGKFE